MSFETQLISFGKHNMSSTETQLMSFETNIFLRETQDVFRDTNNFLRETQDVFRDTTILVDGVKCSRGGGGYSPI